MNRLSSSGRVALGAGLFCLLIGGFALAGWWSDAAPLRVVFGTSGSMKANSGLAFFLAGAALALNSVPTIRRWEWFAAGSMALLVTLLGGATTRNTCWWRISALTSCSRRI